MQCFVFEGSGVYFFHATTTCKITKSSNYLMTGSIDHCTFSSFDD
jgi:hypothetical protein